ncbi:MAG TPA: hypothetical protein VFR67_08965 [Pilimelia sp.]|nr:hypothetical protein [Pilimelia sp.]
MRRQVVTVLTAGNGVGVVAPAAGSGGSRSRWVRTTRVSVACGGGLADSSTNEPPTGGNGRTDVLVYGPCARGVPRVPADSNGTTDALPCVSLHRGG